VKDPTITRRQPTQRYNPVPTPRYMELIMIERSGVRYDREATKIMFPFLIVVSQNA
jgi:hypothetical protein